MRASAKWIIVPLLVVIGGLVRPGWAADRRQEFFRSKVEPILIGRCLDCHGAERKGKLDLRTQATAMKGGEDGVVIVPGKPDESLLYDYVSSKEMPPKKPLSAAEIAVLKRWIADGAYYPNAPLDPYARTTEHRAGYDWWSLKPLADVKPPRPKGLPAAWGKNPIDRFVFARLAEKKLRPSSPADPRTLIRRATYDLTGLPPTPREVAAFITACKSETGSTGTVGEKSYTQLVDRLLKSPRYGEQWGRHWLDVVRFGESTGFERNTIINNAWPFRDYVIRSFNEDKPFDRFIIEQLAGDVIGNENPDVEVGTTFLVCGPYDNVGNQDPVQAAQIRANTIDEIIRTTGEAFLGLTVGCGRCHDHKFDPITQGDYYSLYATFAGVHHGSRVIASAELRQKRNAIFKPLKTRQTEIAKQQRKTKAEILARAKKKAAVYQQRWKRPPIKRSGVEETFVPRLARYVRLIVEGLDTNPKRRTGYRIDEFEVWTAGPHSRNVALAANGGRAEGLSRIAQDFADAYSAKLTIDGKYGARWVAAGPELTITLAQPQTISRVVFSSDRRMAIGRHRKTTFVGEYRIQVSLDGKSWTEVANSRDRQPVSMALRRKRLLDLEATTVERRQLKKLDHELREVNRRIAALPPLPSWWVGTYRKPAGPFHIFVGGNPQRKGKTVTPASLSTLSRAAKGYRLEANAAEGQRRLALAKWIVEPENPLTPRVLVNRLWHYRFGTGIVATPSDFGFMGGRPSHPRLLDWLARQLRATHWHLKSMHRLMMLSQSYRQASVYRTAAAKIDGDSRLLWRFPPRRLSGEEIRDTVLQITGKLRLKPGGPGFRLYRYLQDNVATYVPLDHFGPETFRRAVYHQNARAARVDLMTDFDSPDCAFATPRRTSTTTPLQALTLMNHSFTLEMAAALATRLTTDAGPQPSAQVRRAFELAFSRPPDKGETAAAIRLIQKYGLRAFCRALLNTNELIYLN